MSTARVRPAGVRILNAHDFAPHTERAVAIYLAAMSKPRVIRGQRLGLTAQHLRQAGFLAAGAFDDDLLVGFAYGYTGAPGQWWRDAVFDALPPQGAHEWLHAAFVIAEVHVLPDRQGDGLGRAVLETLLGVIPADVRTVVLSTYDEDSPARALYRSVGFVDLLTGFRFPGGLQTFAVMGLRREPA